MKRASVSLRIPERLYQAARRYAEAHDQTTYRVLNTAIEHGLADLLTQGARASSGAPSSEIADALAELDVKAERLARGLDRILHVASAAYAFGRFAALRGEREVVRVDQSLSDEAGAVYRRQIDLAKP